MNISYNILIEFIDKILLPILSIFSRSISRFLKVRENLFQEIDGVFTNINPNTGTVMPAMRCLIVQTFNIQQGISTGGNEIGDDYGGIINPISFIVFTKIT